MILPIDKLLSYSGNKYILTRAGMQAVDKRDKIADLPENLPAWKTVPIILRMVLDERVKIKHPPMDFEVEAEPEIETETEN